MDHNILGGSDVLSVARGASTPAPAGSDGALAGVSQGVDVVARLRRLLEELEFTEAEFCQEIGGPIEEAQIELLQGWVERLEWAARRFALEHVSDLIYVRGD